MSEDEMDERRRKKANEIIDKMTTDGATREDINIQKKANKKLLGHEGEPEL